MEINLLKNYPKTKRDLNFRANNKTENDRILARKFEKDFFDGDRKNGYGGFYYNPKFWTPVIPDFVSHYNLTKDSKILDVGCAKGFMLYDFIKLMPGIDVRGVDISNYAIDNSIPEIKNYLKVANALELPFDNNEFDLVISITTVHNLEIEECKKSIKEISRVSKKNSFITVDAYRNEEQKKAMMDWNLTAKTILHVDDWKKMFNEIDYSGDFYWFIP